MLCCGDWYHQIEFFGDYRTSLDFGGKKLSLYFSPPPALHSAPKMLIKIKMMFLRAVMKSTQKETWVVHPQPSSQWSSGYFH